MQPRAVKPTSAPSGSTGSAPAEDLQTFLYGDGFDVFARGGAGDGVLWKEADASGEGVGVVRRGRRKVELDDLFKEFDG